MLDVELLKAYWIVVYKCLAMHGKGIYLDSRQKLCKEDFLSFLIMFLFIFFSFISYSLYCIHIHYLIISPNSSLSPFVPPSSSTLMLCVCAHMHLLACVCVCKPVQIITVQYVHDFKGMAYSENRVLQIFYPSSDSWNLYDPLPGISKGDIDVSFRDKGIAATHS